MLTLADVDGARLSGRLSESSPLAARTRALLCRVIVARTLVSESTVCLVRNAETLSKHLPARINNGRNLLQSRYTSRQHHVGYVL